MADKRHWSFDDATMLRNKIFPEGFAAAESTLPTEPFNPCADWENRYDVVYCGTQNFTEDRRTYYGSLHLKAEFGDEAVSFSVRSIRQTGQNFKQERQYASASFTTERDELYSLKPGASWNVDISRKNQRDAATAPYSRLEEKGRLRNGMIEKADHKGNWFRYAETDPEPVVAGWALFAAVQTLSRSGRFSFGCLQYLERFFPENRIQFYKSIDARFGANQLALHGYVHTGRGITPQFYWVDDSGRLLIARLALEMLVYNASPHLDKFATEDAI